MQSQYYTVASLVEVAIAASTEKISSVLLQPITLQDKHCFGQKQKYDSYLRGEGRREKKGADKRKR